MPKQKTHKGTKKRFRLTAKGKAKHRQSGTSHLAARMSHKRKRNLRGTAVVDDTDGKKIVEALCGNLETSLTTPTSFSTDHQGHYFRQSVLADLHSRTGTITLPTRSGEGLAPAQESKDSDENHQGSGPK